MAWIITLEPTARHPKPRKQVVYYDQTGRQRSGGIYATDKQAATWKRNIERGKFPPKQPRRRNARPAVVQGDHDASRASIVTLGDYVTHRWWTPWKQLHPGSAPSFYYVLNNRILPTFGHLALTALDADVIAGWKAAMIAEGLKPHTVNGYLNRLTLILNAAVDAGYLGHNPMKRRSGSGRVPILRSVETDRVEAWLSLPQLEQLAAVLDARYRALILLTGRTGLRFGEVAALLWSALDLDAAYDDGAVAGPGRLHITEAISDPTRSGRGVRARTKTRAGRRTLALDKETVEALRIHQKRFGQDAQGRVFTTAGGTRGPSRTLATSGFGRVWGRALRDSGLADEFPTKPRMTRVKRDGRLVQEPVETSVLTFHVLRHSHATHLIAQGRPLNAVAARLGHTSVAFTMDVYATVISLRDAGGLTPQTLGL